MEESRRKMPPNVSLHGLGTKNKQFLFRGWKLIVDIYNQFVKMASLTCMNHRIIRCQSIEIIWEMLHFLSEWLVNESELA